MSTISSEVSILLLAPSRGLGGGIERFVLTIESALREQKVAYSRLDLRRSGQPTGIGGKLRFLRDVARAVSASGQGVRLVVAHRNLAPAIVLAARHPHFRGATVIFHGRELWSHRRRWANRVLRRRDVRAVAVSNFSAGAVMHVCRAKVLHPGLSRDWFDTLVLAGDQARRRVPAREPQWVVLTTFRLADWQVKGLATLIDAIDRLADDRIALTVCGSGPVPARLRELVASHPWCQIVNDPTDAELADRYATADLFALATRTARGSSAGGEGFGLVLLEAQIAGTPVVAPAYGGSGDAYQPGLTGLSPIDETPEALAAVLRELLYDDARRAEMGSAAAMWARSRFDPGQYSRQAVASLTTEVP